MIGVDEVGRGCWAGPMLVVAARAKADLPEGLKDSKLLSKKQRLQLFAKLSTSCDFGEGWVDPAEIDKYGLTKSQFIGVERALKQLDTQLNEKIIIDGNYNYAPIGYRHAKALVKADNLVSIVSAASIYAKVTRDKYMEDLAQQYPKYSFDKHVGYGTKLHIEALSNFGIIDQVHRLSYSPIAKLAGGGL